MFTAYKNLGFNIKDYPNAFDMYRNEITLPLHTLLSDDDVKYIIKKLIEIIYRLKQWGGVMYKYFFKRVSDLFFYCFVQGFQYDNDLIFFA